MATLLIMTWQVLLGVLVQVACQFVPVVLLGQYMRAVRDRENDPPLLLTATPYTKSKRTASESKCFFRSGP